MLSANPKDERRRQTNRNAERNAKKREKLSAHEKDGRERQTLFHLFHGQTKRNAERNATQKQETNRERERERERDPKHRSSVQLNVLCRYSHQGQRDRVVKVMD